MEGGRKRGNMKRLCSLIVTLNTPHWQLRSPLDDVAQSCAPVLGIIVGLALVKWWL